MDEGKGGVYSCGVLLVAADEWNVQEHGHDQIFSVVEALRAFCC